MVPRGGGRARREGIVARMLLVFGPRSTDYDFGPGHPLTPRRFGPSIDLLRAVGATPGLAPEPASDAELRWCHDAGYLEVVKRLSRDPFGLPQAGIADGGDCPPFGGMHEASAAVAGGSIRAMEAILRGDVEHAQHPGGGLHHAMAARASGFCIYNDAALAIARARRDGLRVLYIDLDVHHGDGVQALHWSDPGVLTVSIHETGATLFPGTGAVNEIGEGIAAGTAVNLPLPPGTGDGGWSPVLASLLPELAAAFGPDLIVSQHGADSHAWDPLAHLNVTTAGHGAAARLVDHLAHRFAGGRWLATGGGGYDAYRVVPRTWALTWLAGAHRPVPDATPVAWRERWADEAARYGQTPLPMTFEDEPGAGLGVDATQSAADRQARDIAAIVRRALVPRLVQVARDRDWWDPAGAVGDQDVEPEADGSSPTVMAAVDRATWAGLVLSPRVVPPADPATAHAIIDAALGDGARVSVAVAGSTVVGLVVSHGPAGGGPAEVLAAGVGPGHRRTGLATALLAAHLDTIAAGTEVIATVTVGERDVVEPLDRQDRAAIARRLLETAGFAVAAADPAIRRVDPGAIVGRRTVG